MRCLTYEGGKFVDWIMVTKWAAKYKDRATQNLVTGPEKEVVAVGLDGGLGSASRQQRLSLCTEAPPAVTEGRILEAHPAEICPRDGGKSKFTVLRKVGAGTRWDHGALVRVSTRIEFQAPAGISVRPWGGKVALAANKNGSSFLILGTTGPWDDALVVLYPGDALNVKAGIGYPTETAIVNDLKSGVIAIAWGEWEKRQTPPAPAAPSAAPAKPVVDETAIAKLLAAAQVRVEEAAGEDRVSGEGRGEIPKKLGHHNLTI